MYQIGDWVTVDDRMQTGYRYRIAAPAGRDFDAGFTPRFTPAEMLALGVFEGKYCNDCTGELPAAWFECARISDRPDPKLNYFGVKSRQPLSEWRRKGWIYGEDPRGWFQWYCRYWLGRRMPEIDRIRPPRRPDPRQLRAGGPRLPTPPAPGAAAMVARPVHLKAARFSQAEGQSVRHGGGVFSDDRESVRKLR